MYLEVYPDIIFILNFIIDLLLIFLLRKVNRKRSTLLRMTGAAACGAVFAVILGIYPWMNLLLRFLLMYVIASLLMILIAFGKLKMADMIKQLILLYLFTYFVGGLINSIYYYIKDGLVTVNLGNGMIFSNISLKFILIVLGIITPFILFGIWIFRWYQSLVPTTYEVELFLEDRRIMTEGLMDTGNCLYDPIYKSPVMVMDNSLMNSLLSDEFRRELEEARCYMNSNDYDTGKWEIEKEHLLRLRFIPYQSIGKSGILLGIRLDKVLIHTGNETKYNEKVIAAISDNHLSSRQEYHVILHKGLL